MSATDYDNDELIFLDDDGSSDIDTTIYKEWNILIVDDDNRIRDLLKDYLSENNYIVSTAENADQAKEKLEYLKFDIIILDVMMPGQNGYELTKDIKKKINVPIVLLTAKGEVENRIKGLELGADDYIGKPFDSRELLLKIEKNISKKQSLDLVNLGNDTEFNGTCFSCNVVNCTQCIANNLCSTCNTTYILKDNNCSCPDSTF